MPQFEILIVEDDSLIAWTIQMALERHGHRVIGIAGTEAEALELAETMHPDAAVVDVRLGQGGNGLTVAQALRKRYRTAILLATAQCQQFQKNRGMLSALVPVVCLAKPYNPSAVPAALDYAWSMTHRATTSEPPPPGLQVFDRI